MREKPWHVRVGLLLVVVWAVWLFAFVVWAWNVSEWRSGDLHVGYTVVSVMASIAVAIGLAVALLAQPGWGEVGGGLLVTGVAAIGSANAVDGLAHWGERVDDVPDRWTPWVPLDSLAALPYGVLLVAGVLLVVGGIAHLVHPTHRSTPHVGAAT